MERRLAAIMFVDIVGYTALMAKSESQGLRVRERHRTVARLGPSRVRGSGEPIEMFVRETGNAGEVNSLTRVATGGYFAAA